MSERREFRWQASVLTIKVGTSGWDYRDWVGPFYPERGEPRLTLYARVFDTTEVNSTFYQLLDPQTFEGMAKVTPEGFEFAVKMLRDVTHRKRLRLDRGIKDDLRAFFDSLEPLKRAGKLGPVLVQLPPVFRAKLDRLEQFLSLVPSDVRVALEFRHPSWDDPKTYRLLESANAAYVMYDAPGRSPELRVTSDIAYVRWHGRGEKVWYNYLYEEEELKPWAKLLEEAEGQTKKVYGYFNNHYHAYAPENAVMMLKMLGKASEDQEALLNKIRSWRESLVRAEARASLLEFVEGEVEAKPSAPEPSEDVIGLLKAITDERRLERALSIPKEEVEILADRGDLIMARVRGYDVTIDLARGLILHDCADWDRQFQKKMFCKHLAALFLQMPPERAKKVLRWILTNRDEITFRPFTGDGRRW